MGLELWARLDGADLELVEDPAPASVTETYHRWLRDDRIHVVLGSYGSGLVRRTLPAVDGAGKVLWNHGGSADDLTRPGVVQVVAPASGYLVGAVRLCARLGIPRLAIVTGRGPFAAFVARGARDEARRLGIEARIVAGTDRLPTVDAVGAVLVTAGFQEDVAVVERIRAGPIRPALLGCVAAGVPQFAERLGPARGGRCRPYPVDSRNVRSRGGALRGALPPPLRRGLRAASRICGGPGSGCRVPGGPRPPPRHGARRHARLAFLHPAGRVRPRRTVAAGRVRRLYHPLARWPYGVGPDRPRPRWRRARPGSGVAPLPMRSGPPSASSLDGHPERSSR